MKSLLFFFLLIFARVLCGVDFESEAIQKNRAEEGRQDYQACEEIAKIYEKVDGATLKDITDELDDPRLKESNRRIVLFQYPSDGLLIKGYVSYVDTLEEKPLLVFLRGGNEFFGVMHPVTSYSLLGDYTVVASCYRGGVSEGRDEFGGADVNDVYNLVQHIPTLEKNLNLKIDHKKRYILGGSRGGFEMFLALMRYPDLQEFFDGAIALSSPLDLKSHIQSRPDMLAMFKRKFDYTGEEWLEKRDPLSNIDKIRTDFPLLILQGTEDIRTPVEEGRTMAAALKAKGCMVDYLEVEGGDHCLKNMCDERVQILLEWLDK